MMSSWNTIPWGSSPSGQYANVWLFTMSIVVEMIPTTIKPRGTLTLVTAIPYPNVRQARFVKIVDACRNIGE